MELAQILIIVLILVIIYMLLQKPRRPRQNRVVYLSDPYVNYGVGQGPLWWGARPR